MQMEEVRDKHNTWLVRALRDTAVNLHLSHDTPATINSLSPGSPAVPGISRTGEGVLVPVSKRQHAVVFTHNCTHTHVFRHMHLHICSFVNDTNRINTCTFTFHRHLVHSTVRTYLTGPHATSSLSVTTHFTKRSQQTCGGSKSQDDESL